MANTRILMYELRLLPIFETREFEIIFTNTNERQLHGSKFEKLRNRRINTIDIRQSLILLHRQKS